MREAIVYFSFPYIFHMSSLQPRFLLDLLSAIFNLLFCLRRFLAKTQKREFHLLILMENASAFIDCSLRIRLLDRDRESTKKQADHEPSRAATIDLNATPSAACHGDEQLRGVNGGRNEGGSGEATRTKRRLMHESGWPRRRVNLESFIVAGVSATP